MRVPPGCGQSEYPTHLPHGGNACQDGLAAAALREAMNSFIEQRAIRYNERKKPQPYLVASTRQDTPRHQLSPQALQEIRQSRMDYPRCRRQGLPVTSSLVESLVGEFNARVKGWEKFWNRPEGAEASLQVRAAC